MYTLGLSVSDIPSEELFDTWQGLLALRMRADADLTEMRARFEKATNVADRERLWARLEVLWPSYQPGAVRVDRRGARRDVFATEGYESLFMDDDIEVFTFD